MSVSASGSAPKSEESAKSRTSASAERSHDDAGGSFASSLSELRGEVSMWDVVRVCVIANLGSFLFGFDQGSTSWIISAITESSLISDDDENYYAHVANSTIMEGFLSCLTTLWATFSFIFLMFHANEYSKKGELVLCSMFYTVGYTFSLIAASIKWVNLEDYTVALIVLIIGRLFIGTGVGLSMHAIPQYLGEVAPRSIRGQVGSSIEVAVVIGIGLGMILGYLLSLADETSYLALMACGVLVSVIQAAYVVTIPDSPTHMFANGWWSLSGLRKYTDDDILQSVRVIYPKATLSLVHEMREQYRRSTAESRKWKKIYALEHSPDTTSDSDAIVDRRSGGNGPAAGNDERMGRNGDSQSVVSGSLRVPIGWAAGGSDKPGNSFFCRCPTEPFPLSIEMKTLFTDPAMTQCLALALLQKFFEALTGKGAFGYSATESFSDILPGYGGVCTAGLGLVMIIAAIVSVCISDMFPRNALFLTGIGIVILGQLLMCLFMVVGWNVAAVFAIYLYIAGFELSYGGLGWMMVSEFFPHFVRSTALSVASATSFGSVAIMVIVIPLYQDVVGITAVFLTTALISCVGFVVLYILVPDTQGIHIERAYLEVRKKFLDMYELLGYDMQLKSMFDREGLPEEGETEGILP